MIDLSADMNKFKETVLNEEEKYKGHIIRATEQTVALLMVATQNVILSIMPMQLRF